MKQGGTRKCAALRFIGDRSDCGSLILALLLEVGPEQFEILDGGQEKENAYEKVFHKKPGMKNIKNTGALQGRVNTRGAEEQLVG